MPMPDHPYPFPKQNSQIDYFKLCEKPNIITASLIKEGVRASTLKAQTSYMPARTSGSVVHALILEPENFANYFEVVDDDFDYKLFDSLIIRSEPFYHTNCDKGKASKAFKDAVALGKKAITDKGYDPYVYHFITTQEYESLKLCHEISSRSKTPISRSLLNESSKQADLILKTMGEYNIFREGNLYEQIFICDLKGKYYTVEEAFAETSKPLLMCKPDILIMDFVHNDSEEDVVCIKYLDIKTTANANIDFFRSQCYRLGYYFQQAFYYYVLSLIEDANNFFNKPIYHGGFIVASTTEAYLGKSCNPLAINNALETVKERIKQYRLCFASGIFEPKTCYEYI